MSDKCKIKGIKKNQFYLCYFSIKAITTFEALLDYQNDQTDFTTEIFIRKIEDSNDLQNELRFDSLLKNNTKNIFTHFLPISF